MERPKYNKYIFEREELNCNNLFDLLTFEISCYFRVDKL